MVTSQPKLQRGYVTIFSYIKKLLSPTAQSKSLPANYANATVIPRSEHTISRADISENTLKVLRRLHKAGFQSYLVGGGVRDLLLRRAPKDFDVATDAKPEQVYKLFRNCRLIGRRFRLAHILFGREVVEVATFRREADPNTEANQEVMHSENNVYGSLVEDAWRRDFTINALYYAIADFSILDFTGGMQDLENRVIRLIGEPAVRYKEDPVRMLRAIRFAAKLNFTISPETAAPIASMAGLIEQVSSSRLFDEVLKLFFTGHAVATYMLLKQNQLFAKLFPATAACLDPADGTFDKLIQHSLQATDQRIAEDKPVTPGFLLAVFLWLPLQREVDSLTAKGMAPLPAFDEAMQNVVQAQVAILNIPKRFTRVAKEIWFLQYRLPRRQGRRAYRLLEHPRFRACYDFLVLRATVDPDCKALADWWTQFQRASNDTRQQMIVSFQKSERKRK